MRKGLKIKNETAIDKREKISNFARGESSLEDSPLEENKNPKKIINPNAKAKYAPREKVTVNPRVFTKSMVA